MSKKVLLKFILISALFASCGILYKTEQQLKNQLQFFVGKSQTVLIQYWGISDDSQNNGRYRNLIYKRSSTFKGIANLQNSEYYKNGCIFNFYIRNNIVVKFEYSGINCLGFAAVHVDSNWR